MNPELNVYDGVTDSVGGRMLNRRGILAGLAASPFIVALGAPAGTASAATRARSSGAGTAAETIVRGGARRWHGPFLGPGARLLLPAGVKAAPVEDYFTSPRLTRMAYVWPQMQALDGSMVDASIIPEHGAPSRVAVLSGFDNGWYELISREGKATRVAWDHREFPYLLFVGEFGATKDVGFMGKFFTLALEPFSRNPVFPHTPIR
ncbi:hypothetical protein EDD27_8946 [Nonomuraea polychroma]|uniref:Uncharacterized protein n=2 Tax=Nonomuraea polychroma TaxID=46176 RepID=A0A438MKG2_9ACTN|nr:hypothetical protein EDD27_8946 [Nonomuraea polychroma]